MSTQLSYRERLINTRPEATEYATQLRQLPPNLSGVFGRLDQIILYPIKSMGGIYLSACRVGPSGLMTTHNDFCNHGAMLVQRLEKPATEGGVPFGYDRFSIRQESKLSLLHAQYDGHAVSYWAQDTVDPLRVVPGMLLPTSRHARVRIHKEHPIVECTLEDGPITDWVRGFLRSTVKSPRYDIDSVHVALMGRLPVPVSDEVAGRGGVTKNLSDEGQILITSSATLGWMNACLGNTYGMNFNVAMASFRPNLVLGGLPANVEDIAAGFRFGVPSRRLLFSCGSMCGRCAVVNVDPATGESRGCEPQRFLVNQRPSKLDKPSSITFGVFGSFDPCAQLQTVALGASVHVTSEKQ